MPKALVAIVILCACAAAHGATEVRFWHAMSGAPGAELERLVARFNASQKAYRVVASYRGSYDRTLALALREARRGDGPQIVQVDDAQSEDVARSGVARPLWQVAGTSGLVIGGKFLPAVQARFSDREGRLLALPFNVQTPVLYYSREAFRKAGLDPSRPPRTWYEMPAALAALVDSGQRCPLTTASQTWVLLENMSAWHNQAFAADGASAGAPSRLMFNRRLIVRWISMLSSWQKSGYFSYSGRNDQGEARFVSGECAMLTASSAMLAKLRGVAKFDFAVAQLPYFDDFADAPQNTLIGGAALWLLATDRHAAEQGAAAFLAYLARADVQAEWHQRTGCVPTTLAAYELTRAQGFYWINPGHEVAVRQVLAKVPALEPPGIRLGPLRRLRSIIDEELEAVWSGSKTPLDALNEAVGRGNLLLERDVSPLRPAHTALR